ncbi:MAG: glutaredoxin family protein [Bacillota bacterium]|nr:glutaredoxin family protein [Bacillota bacterium]MDW7684305.1 glutaredoxin family protein [Bacillota bacterium]
MHSVDLYTVHGCIYCLRVKEYLSEKKVDFTEYNVEDDSEARERMVDLSGHTTIPTIVVDEDVVVGYDPKRLAKLLE